VVVAIRLRQEIWNAKARNPVLIGGERFGRLRQ
jgi:hypothetical protein